MAAVSASRCNPDMARKYAELRERGKPPKIALTVVMRKLVVLVNALLKRDRTWTRNPCAAERWPGSWCRRRPTASRNQAPGPTAG